VSRFTETVKEKRSLIVNIVSILILVGLMAAVAIWLWPWFASLATAEGREAFKEYILSQGFVGWLILLGIQVLQVIIAVIPGEPVEVMAGVVAGTWGGLAVCLAGVAIGSCIVFLATRLLGYPLVTAFVSEEKLSKLKFLQDAKKLDMLVFLLFFIPGTPKDWLTYFVGLTKMRLSRFLVIATLARIPSIITSTYAGASLIEGDLVRTVIIFLITGTIGIAGILANNKIMAWMERRKNGGEAESAPEAAPEE